ncbi:calcium/sodium antiporter [Spirochaeta dissipatitropha]
MTEIILNSLLILGGLLSLYFGAEYLVRSAVAGAARLKISPLIVGLTVVAFGTSAPEMVVSVVSAVRGFPSVAVGNVFGSNILNIALVIGLLSLFMPLKAHRQLLRFDFPIMISGYVLLLLFLSDFSWPLIISGLNRIEGFFLLSCLGVYIVKLYRMESLAERPAEHAVETEEILKSVHFSQSWSGIIFFFLTGILLLGFGGDFLLKGAVWYASEVFLISERVIGVTVVAFSTSLPELITSIVALTRKESDISLGNIIGSNIFNTLGVLGIAAIVRPLTAVEGAFSFDIAVMFFISIFLWIFLAKSRSFGKLHGVFLLLVLSVYTFIILQ